VARLGLVGVPTLVESILSDKAYFLIALENERRIELTFENSCRYDLLRWVKAVKTMSTFFKIIGSIKVTVIPDRVLYPIPKRDIDLANIIITQNPSY